MTGYSQIMLKACLVTLVYIILLSQSAQCLKSNSDPENTVITMTQNTVEEVSKLVHSRQKRQSMMYIQHPRGTVNPHQVLHRPIQPTTNQHHPVIRKPLVPPPQFKHQQQQQQFFHQQQQQPLRQLPAPRFQQQLQHHHQQQQHNQLQFPAPQPQVFEKAFAQERVQTVRQQAAPPVSMLRHPTATPQVAKTDRNRALTVPDTIASQTDKSKLGFLHHSSVTHETRTTLDSTIHKTESKQLTIAHPDTTSLGNLLGSVNLTVNPTDLQALKDRYNSEDTTLDTDIVVAYGGYNSYARRAKEVDPKGHRIEGLDMCLTKEQYKLFHESSREKRKAIRPTSYLWTNGIIPYTIETSFPSQDVEKIHMSMSVWERETCIRFRKASSRDRNYVVIKNGQGSHVGMIGGAQELTLHPNCRKKQQIIVHELGHAIGMIHEHQRPDRNDYVVIKQENAMDNTAADFRMYSWNVINSHSVQYDYQSIMHYGGTAFARTPNAITIQTIDPFYQDFIGKATTISQSDVTTVQRMYNCEVKQTRQNFLSSLFPTSNFGMNFNRNPVNLIRVERPRFNRRVVRPQTVLNRLPGSTVQSRPSNRIPRRRLPTRSNWINNIVAPFFQNGLNSPRTRF